MEDQTVNNTKKIDIQLKSLSLAEKSLSIQKDRKVQREKKNEIFKNAIENS